MTRFITSILSEEYGYEVYCLAHTGDALVWGGKTIYKGIPVLAMSNPQLAPKETTDIVNMYVRRYGIDLILAHWDAMALEWLGGVGLPYLVYIPIEGAFTRKWAHFVERATKVVTYSEFGYEECTKFFPPSKVRYIPHTVDTGVFKPSEESRESLRKRLQLTPPLPEKGFTFITTGANMGPRKLLMNLITTFKRLVDDGADAHLVLHTNAYNATGNGYDLPAHADDLGIASRVHFPMYDPILEPLTDRQMSDLYSACDVYVTNSLGEGFGLPVLEALSNGLPVIAPDNSSHTELVGQDRGWLFSCLPEDMYVDYPAYTPYNSYFRVPDQLALYKAMKDAYGSSDLDAKGKQARHLAMKYDWKLVKPLWKRLIDDTWEEIELGNSVVEAMERR
jgi:glycosyltransferase involved in cell wall biosynthesis